MSSAKLSLKLTINGEVVERQAECRETLAELIREGCNLTATHIGCEHGVCGACTIDVDGRTTRACLVLAPMAEGCQVTTLEGFADDPVMQVRPARRAKNGGQINAEQTMERRCRIFPLGNAARNAAWRGGFRQAA